MIDDHAHPFTGEFCPLELSKITLGAPLAPGAANAGHGPRRVFAELLSVRLARLLSVPVQELAQARNELAAADWPGYVRRLFDDAGISAMVIDEGVASFDGAGLKTCAEVAARPMWALARIDPLVDQAIAAGACAEEIVLALEAYVEGALEQGAVGFKTILAYRTGLEVDPHVTIEEAEASLEMAREDELAPRRAGKALRDLVTVRLLSLAADCGRPVQIHTGFGDSDIRLGESNPLLLEELLRSPAGRAATIVLIHGAYPWHEEVAYLATVCPKLYAEVSLSNLFAPLLVTDRLARILELAPLDKVLAGSDGHGLPETHWFACRVLQEAFEGVGKMLLAAGARAGFVREARSRLLEDNARVVYGLS
ncbi:MAG: amidohydrolase family protein [Acidimicrobiales bacterium]